MGVRLKPAPLQTVAASVNVLLELAVADVKKHLVLPPHYVKTEDSVSSLMAGTFAIAPQVLSD